MDTSMIAAVSAILGTTVGGLTTFLTTFLNQRFAMRRDVLAKDVANREQLYTEFLKEVGNLYFDSVHRTLNDAAQHSSLITMYSLVGRIRMISSEGVLTAAENVAEDIVESYKRPPMTFQEFQQLWGLRSVAQAYQRMSNRAAEHAGTLVTDAIVAWPFHCLDPVRACVHLVKATF